MNDSYIALSNWQVAIAAALILFNGAISVALELKLERRLLLAAIRTISQLYLLGLVLDNVFAIESVWMVAGLAALMTTIAGVAAVNRNQRRYPGIWLNSLCSMFASSWLITIIALTTIVRPSPWYAPQYAIPLLGMLLGNTLNGVSLGLDRLLAELSRRDEVETLLAMGATRWEAARSAIQNSVRTGMVPIINSMMIVGIVSLPGMMTGQLLAGAAPADAVKYQVVIMFLIAAAAAFGAVSVVLLAFRRLFNRYHQFLSDRIIQTDRH